MDTDRQEAKKRVRELSFKEKIKHYWGYYKVYFFVLLAVCLLIGSTIYQKATEIKPKLKVMVFSQSIIDEDVEKQIDEQITKFAFEENSEEYVAKAYITHIPFYDEKDYEAIHIGCTKLTAELMLDEMKLFILDKEAYEYTIQGQNPNEVWDEKYSGQIGKNGKKALGLNEDEEFYFLTQVMHKNKKGNKDNQEIIEHIKKTYKEIKALD